MKCPYCGSETDGKKAYCPDCGGKLKKEDNSMDDTLRLPDLSNVPLGGAPRARREPPSRKSPVSAWLIFAVCIVAAAAAVLAALLLLGRPTNNSLPEEPAGADESYDGGDFGDIPDFTLPDDGQEPTDGDEPAVTEPDADGENGGADKDENKDENGDGDLDAPQGGEEPETNGEEPAEPSVDGGDDASPEEDSVSQSFSVSEPN